MKADAEKAVRIGSRLVLYKDSLAKNQIEVLDAANLRAILDDTSPEPLAAEEELVMAWRFYTQVREQQIAWGEFQFCSSPDEIKEAGKFSRARNIIFDPANVKGIECVKSEIEVAIEKHVFLDVDKWQAVEAQEEKWRKEWFIRWKPNQAPVKDTAEDKKSRNDFADGCVQWIKDKARADFLNYRSRRMANAIRLMLDEHRNFWAQRPTEP